jgi:hypothetical protein
MRPPEPGGVRRCHLGPDHDGLLRVDPATRALTDTIDFGFGPADVVVSGDELWIDEPPDGETRDPTKLLRLDPGT